MAELDSYIDIRRLLPGFEQNICPTSGDKEWMKPGKYGPVCWYHGDYMRRVIEVPCPECDTRMVGDGDVWECRQCGTTRERDTETLVDRLSTNAHFTRGMAGVLMGECPVCGSDSGVNGDPDGALECQDCNGFYAGRYSDQWYAYAHWMQDEMDVRVHTEDAL